MFRYPRLVALALLAPSALVAQRATQASGTARPTTPPPVPTDVTQPFDSVFLTGLRWRELGPYRGGRSVAVSGSVARPNEYYMGTVGGGVFKTTDGGLRWKRLESIERLVAQPSESSAFNFGFSDVNFIDAEHGWAVGNFYGRARTHIGGLFVTTDGGETWRRMPIVIQAQNNATRFTRGLLHAVKFTDLNHGLVTGEMEDGEETFVFTLRTRDGGQTWEQARVPARSIQGTQFVDAARGWAAAPAERAGSAGKAVYDTVLLRTGDGGRTWEPDHVAPGSRVRGVFFISPTQGWAVGDGGLILRYEAKQEKASK